MSKNEIEEQFYQQVREAVSEVYNEKKLRNVLSCEGALKDSCPIPGTCFVVCYIHPTNPEPISHVKENAKNTISAYVDEHKVQTLYIEWRLQEVDRGSGSVYYLVFTLDHSPKKTNHRVTFNIDNQEKFVFEETTSADNAFSLFSKLDYSFKTLKDEAIQLLDPAVRSGEIKITTWNS